MHKNMEQKSQWTKRASDKLPKGEKQLRQAVNLINKEITGIIDETSDEDIKYEVGKAWSITKEYLNIK
jgi:hypothetical protein